MTSKPANSFPKHKAIVSGAFRKGINASSPAGKIPPGRGGIGGVGTVSKLLTTQHLPQDVEPLPEIQLLTGEHLYTLQ